MIRRTAARKTGGSRFGYAELVHRLLNPLGFVEFKMGRGLPRMGFWCKTSLVFLLALYFGDFRRRKAEIHCTDDAVHLL